MMKKKAAVRRNPGARTEPKVIPGPRIALSSPLYYQNRQRDPHEEPFFVLFLKTGLTLLVLCSVAFVVFSYQSLLPSNDYNNRNNGLELPARVKIRKRPHNAHFPIFTLGPDAETDAFAVATKYNLTVAHDADGSAAVPTNPAHHKVQTFINHAAKIRSDFVEIYDGEISARSILERGLSHMSSNDRLAQRIQQRSITQRTTTTASDSMPPEFIVLIVGSSAAAGYGNSYQQSYPFQMERILQHAFSLATGLTLTVRSVAMEDATEFPFSWYLASHYSPQAPDMIMWDFGADTPPARFEAFLRVTARLWNNTNQEDRHRPFFMFREGSVGTEQRSQVIQHYRDAAILVDPVIIRHSQAAQPFLTMNFVDRPDGLNAWRTFGVTGPAQSLTLLSLQQHQMIAWLTSMHLLMALELVTADHLSGGRVLASTTEPTTLAATKLPPPLWNDFERLRGKAWAPLVLGEYDPSRLHCYTSFDRTTRDYDMEPEESSAADRIASNLHELVVRGTIGQEFELLLPKTAMWYTQGWVLDLDTTTRRSKLLLKESDFLGFPDWKKAYYGVPQSGPLELFLPVGDDARLLENRPASEFVDLLVVCESDAPQEASSCTLRADTTVQVGGQPAVVTAIDTDIVASFEKQTCVHVAVPLTARLVKRPVSTRSSRTNQSASYGVLLTIQVTSKRVTWTRGPCSVAHVIYQRTESNL